MSGAAIFRMHSIEDVPDILSKMNPSGYSYLDNALHNRVNITNIANYLLSLDKDSWAKRIERNYLDIYTNEESVYDTLLLEFKDIVRLASKPNSKNLDMLDSTSIVVRKLPHDRFNYKVYLCPHRVKDIESKAMYVKWLSEQPAILISDTVKKWFITTSWNWDRRYIHVEDSATLLMLKMRNPEAIGKVYDYKIVDK